MVFLWYTQELAKAGSEITKDMSGGILQDITKGASILKYVYHWCSCKTMGQHWFSKLPCHLQLYRSKKLMLKFLTALVTGEILVEILNRAPGKPWTSKTNISTRST